MGRSEDAGPFLHLASSENSAAAIRAGLRRVGRDEPVEHFWDDLSVGPLRDVDRGAASRAAWWSRVHGRDLAAKDAGKLDDRDSWSRIVKDRRNVVLWYGPHPTEFLYALRACWMLRRSPFRIYEVRLPPHPDPDLERFYGAVGIVGPEGVARAWPTLRRVRDSARRAEYWASLRSHSGDSMRLLKGQRIQELPVTYRDADLVAQCFATWTSSMVVRVREDPRLRATVRAEISTDGGRKLFDAMFGPVVREVAE